MMRASEAQLLGLVTNWGGRRCVSLTEPYVNKSSQQKRLKRGLNLAQGLRRQSHSGQVIVTGAGDEYDMVNHTAPTVGRQSSKCPSQLPPPQPIYSLLN